MKRLIEGDLLKWKKNPNRKPLLINGIRQVGKTWLVKDFGSRHFPEFLYVNFDLEPAMADIFRKTKDPGKIILELSIFFGKKIDTKQTLVFFDEIQSCNEALNSLKYFEEADEEYYIIGAGSNLGITLSKGDSFPVGKVDFIELSPMSFKEFLIANQQDMLVSYMESIDTIEEIPAALFEKMKDLFREYYIVGGMPEAVNDWIIHKDIAGLEKIQTNILNAYYRDFSKYPPSHMIPRILGVWDAVVPQLSKENRKFKYSEIDKGARAREYETALDWLLAGGYIHKVKKIDKAEIPLIGYTNENHFKIFMPDIGLLRKKAEYPASAFSSLNEGVNLPFKGAMAENAVFQELRNVHPTGIFYWSNQQYEIDFVIQRELRVYPIEVKYGENIKSRSLTKFLELHPELTGVRYSMKNLAYDGRILNIPLPLIGETSRILKTLEDA